PPVLRHFTARFREID
ncbi:tryptophanase, partial [Vibrio parahaemolyticus IDH02189]